MEQITELVAAAQAGDKKAFNQLYEYSYPTVRKECMAVLHNPIDAEDAIQETYIRAYKKLGSLQKPERFLTWCRQIAHNYSVDFVIHRDRKAGKDDYRPPVSEDGTTGMDILDDADTEPTPEESAEREVTHELLQQAVDSLPPQRAMCLALNQQGYKYNQIAEKLSIPVGTVKSNVHYAKKELEQQIHKIEKEQNIKIYGFTLMPVDGTVVAQMHEGGFIQAEVEDPAQKKKIWKKIAKRIPAVSPVKMPLWQKVVAIVLALLVIAGGIIFMVYYAGRDNVPQTQQTRPKTVNSRSGETSGQANDRAAQGQQNNNAGAAQTPRVQAPQRVAPQVNRAGNAGTGNAQAPAGGGNEAQPAAPANNNGQQGMVGRIAQAVQQMADDEEAAVNNSNSVGELVPQVVDAAQRAINSTFNAIDDESARVNGR